MIFREFSAWKTKKGLWNSIIAVSEPFFTTISAIYTTIYANMSNKSSKIGVDVLRIFYGAGYRSRTFSGSNPPTANFFRLLCSVYLPQKVRGIFGLKTQKTGPGAVSLAIPKPVFSGFTVFWAISALKTRKLPDLSCRQIRQLLWKR